MEMFQHILTQMLVIFGVVLVGYFATKRGLWATEMSKLLTRFVLNVTVPLIILASVMGEGLHFATDELVQLCYVAVIIHVVLVAAAYGITAFWHLPADRKGIMRFVITFGNVTFIGFPVVSAVYGDKAVFYASVLTIPFNLLMYTIGMLFVRGEGRLRQLLRPEVLLSPCVVAAVLALIIAFTGIQTPAPVAKFCHLIGDMTIPCALLIIGATLTSVPRRSMLGNRFVYSGLVLRLAVMPLLVWCVMQWVPCSRYVRDIAILICGMPVGANGVMFCLQYGKDERTMAQSIFLSTFWSVLSIPLLVLLIDHI